MEVHSVGNKVIEDQIERIKAQHVPKKGPQAFVDPIKEFTRASEKESMVRNWLTYPLEERKRLVKTSLRFVPRIAGDEREGRLPEKDEDFENRQLERWRALCVVIQEESRTRYANGKPQQGSVEVAIAALKQLFYAHNWDAEKK